MISGLGLVITISDPRACLHSINLLTVCGLNGSSLQSGPGLQLSNITSTKMFAAILCKISVLFRITKIGY